MDFGQEEDKHARLLHGYNYNNRLKETDCPHNPCKRQSIEPDCKWHCCGFTRHALSRYSAKCNHTSASMDSEIYSVSRSSSDSETPMPLILTST